MTENDISSLYDSLNKDTSASNTYFKATKPCYKRWYMIALYVLSCIVVVAGIIFGLCIIFVEYGQCNRSCRLNFCNGTSDSLCLLNNGIKGKRKSLSNRKKCICTAPNLFEGSIEIDRMAKPTDTWQVDSKETRYCAVPINSTDGIGVTYKSKQDAENENATLLHLGPCGMCSSSEDKEAYNRTAQTLTKIALKATVGSIFSKKLALKKMKESGLSSSCVECWIENMYQTLIHCFGTCITSSRASCDKNGELTKCLYCDEVHSGMYFRRCAGMTRRRAGIETDICRKPGEIVD